MDFDYLEFYRQIDQAYNELIEIRRVFRELRKRTEGFSSRLEGLASDATKIKDKEKNDKITSVLSYLSERFHEIGEQGHDIDSFLDHVRYYDFLYLLDDAEEMTEGEKK